MSENSKDSKKEKTCGECKWWNKYPTTKNNVGPCPILGIRDADASACPAFDDGEYEKAVDLLIEEAEGVISLWQGVIVSADAPGCHAFRTKIAELENAVEKARRGR